MAVACDNACDIIALVRRYGDDGECMKMLEELRWPDGPRCCRCDSAKAKKITGRRFYNCRDCGHQYSVTSGTFLHRTHLPLIKWVIAAALICNAKKGISAKQLSRDIAVTYKVAWAMSHKLRRAMQKAQARQRPFRGTVEVDESYIGSPAAGKRGRGAANKTILFGAKERHSRRVRVCVIPDIRHKTISTAVKRFVDFRAKTLIADQFRAYDPLKNMYTLKRIRHKESYTRGGVHTQGVESLWAAIKRQYHGTHHWISPKHMPLYLAEIAFRMDGKGKAAYQRVLRSALT